MIDTPRLYFMLYTVHGKWLWKNAGIIIPILLSKKNETPSGYALYEMLTINNINSFHNIN